MYYKWCLNVIHVAYLFMANYPFLKDSNTSVRKLIVPYFLWDLCSCRSTWLVSTSSLVRSMKISALPPTTWTSPTSRELIIRWDRWRTELRSWVDVTVACYVAYCTVWPVPVSLFHTSSHIWPGEHLTHSQVSFFLVKSQIMWHYFPQSLVWRHSKPLNRH